MKRKIILFLLALTTCLSILNGLTSVINSVDTKPDLWERQGEIGSTVVAWCANCGQPGKPGGVGSSGGGATTNGNSRGGD